MQEVWEITEVKRKRQDLVDYLTHTKMQEVWEIIEEVKRKRRDLVDYLTHTKMQEVWGGGVG